MFVLRHCACTFLLLFVSLYYLAVGRFSDARVYRYPSYAVGHYSAGSRVLHLRYASYYISLHVRIFEHTVAVFAERALFEH